MSHGMLGKHHSQETKIKMRNAHKGKHNSPDTEFKVGHKLLLGSEKGWFRNGNKVNLGKKHSKEAKEKMSIAMSKRTGENAPNWKGGITQKYKDWRNAVFKRDDWVCQRCLGRGGNLHAHHIVPQSIAPEERFGLDNGATLHIGCHSHIHKIEYGDKFG